MIIKFDSSKYSKPVLRLILAATEKWQCSPSQALVRLLETAAARAGIK